jgi:hypothetical protein
MNGEDHRVTLIRRELRHGIAYATAVRRGQIPRLRDPSLAGLRGSGLKRKDRLSVQILVQTVKSPALYNTGKHMWDQGLDVTDFTGCD